MKKSKLILLLATLFCLVVSVTAQAQDRISDYFFADGNSSYYVQVGEKGSPHEKIPVRFERNSQGGYLEEDPPIPLIGGLLYKKAYDINCYSLSISDNTVTALEWWTRGKGLPAESASRNNLHNNIVLLKLPAGKETLTWTNYIYTDGKLSQTWEMSAKRAFVPMEKDGAWIAVPALQIIRNVFDAEHNPVPDQSITEYWQSGKGKVKEVKVK